VPETDPQTGFVLDTQAEIVARVEGDFEAQGFGHSRFARSLLYPFPRALGMLSYLLQGRLAWVVRQAFVTLAALVNVRRWGDLLGLGYIDAVPEKVTATFTGVAATAIPITTELARGDGQLYTADVGGAVGGGGTVVLALTATEAGDFGASTVSDEFTLTTPIVDVASIAVVASVTQDGADEETREEHGARIAERLQETPQGGSAADYATWAKADLAHVGKVGVYHPSDNVVRVYFVMAYGYGVAGGILPSAGNVTTVQNYIDEVDADAHAIRRPVTAAATAITTTGTATAVTINIGGDPVAKLAAITAALWDLAERQATPAAANTLYLSQLDAAIQNAIGSDDYFTRAAPAANITTAIGQVFTPGAITVS